MQRWCRKHTEKRCPKHALQQKTTDVDDDDDDDVDGDDVFATSLPAVAAHAHNRKTTAADDTHA